MKEFLYKNKIFITGIAIIAIAIAIYFYHQKSNDKVEKNIHLTPLNETKQEVNAQEEKEQTSKMLIDVKGAVVHPGVYDATLDDRVLDLIHKAGGFQKQADQRKVNLAGKVKDEMVIYVPIKGEQMETEINNGTTSTQNQESAKVNLNTATLEQLQTLTGVGPSKATAIIDYREKNGGFKKVDDLKNVTGIGDKTFEKLKDSITVQ